jgi:prepilin-type N-terminal cleavage/methylation domain-containing protein
MQRSSATTKYPSHGFTLVELLMVIAMAGLLLAGFTAFYLSEQRGFRHHQIEVETSQELRTALEQISRDLRSARKDIAFDFNANNPPPPPCDQVRPTFLTADTNTVEFQLDANDDCTVAANDPTEHKGYRQTGTTIEQYDASTNTWVTLADYVSAFTLTYHGFSNPPTDCSQVDLAAPVATPNSIKSIDITITVSRPIVGGLPVNRTESESIQLRNVRCP